MEHAFWINGERYTITTCVDREAARLNLATHLGRHPYQLKDHKPILWLEHNGDPYGGGFTASESNDGGKSWFFRGDVGAMTRDWWRHYAKAHGCTLREAR